MTPARRMWIVFTLCVLVVLCAMGLLTGAVVEMERSAEAMRLQVRTEARARMALWRLDAALMPLVAEQSGRPYFLYALRGVSGKPLEQDSVRTAMAAPVPAKLADGQTFAVYHFAVLPDGTAAVQRPGSTKPVPVQDVPDLLWLQQTGNRKAMAARLGELEAYAAAGFNEAYNSLRQEKTDFGQRQNAANRNIMSSQHQQLANWDQGEANPYAGAKETPATTMWIGPALVVVRRVSIGGQTFLLGSQLNWPAVLDWMRSEVTDLLPAACFVPTASVDESELPYRLATLPARLVPGAVPDAQRGMSPVRTSLLIAWPSLLAAMVAAAVALGRTNALSERRAAFVSAVTHELRTPLTTLSMYTEMLSDGTVTGDAQRGQYMETIRGETSRLCHLVENVLIWSRLDRSGGRPEMQATDPADMVQRIAQRLADRAARSEMELVVEGVDALGDRPVTTDPAAVEQILFNLVDNAAKYAAAADDKRIELSCAREGGRLTLTVRDHGPGIPEADAERVFGSFFRAERDSAGTLGGVGLGLAICRRLAAGIGARVTLEPTDDGAAFTLTIPDA